MQPPRLLPAPFEGVMHPAFCHAVTVHHLIDGWVTPFWRVTNGTPRLRILKEFLAPFTAAGIPVRAQLMGVDPENIALTAARLLELGACGINVNFACPSRQVTSGNAGGGALRDPALMLKIMTRLREVLPEAELSIKIRTGWERADEFQQWLPELTQTARIDWLAVHFRTVREQYAQVPDALERWNAVRVCADKVPVWINGDLQSVADAETAIRATGSAGAMIGRAWLRDPWLFRRLPGDDAIPTQEAGRERFFATAQNAPDAMSPGQRIELGKWLFRKILRD